MTRLLKIVVAVVVLAIVFAGGWFVGAARIGRVIDPEELPPIERAFVEEMRGAALVGQFTTTGRESRPAAPDRYDIYSVEKVGEDEWRFNARIGETGLTVPIVLRMKFVDDTPLILMTDAHIPGMGAGFSARVLFYQGLYAGTWSHGDDRGGHLFGRIERAGAQR